jgi:acyl-coenzyme A synthetase/AMP-(fatty) acid ligase/uncharacterized protein YbaR (Trm112 family)
MLRSILDALACPRCRGTFDVDERVARGPGAWDGFLSCRACRTATPVLQGFPLFPETHPEDSEREPEWLVKQRSLWLDPDGFAEFLRTKSERHLYDGYAFFQPFNESSRALLAVLEALREGLSPGDRILDTWCRTGWMGEWLASLFPEQQVISLWEGNSNVLGYRGFSFWLSPDARLSNLSVLFTHPNEPLPLADSAFALVIGLDSLHRYAPDLFLPECRRVARTDAVLFFPHVHLANSEPEPFFERGCRQLHGREWKALLEPAFAGHPNRPYLLAEPALFDCSEEFVLEDDADTPHYNGAVLIAPRTWQGRRIPTRHTRPAEPGDRLVVNPLLRVDLSAATVELRADEGGGPTRGILERHPIYRDRLARVLGRVLSGVECQVLFLAAQAHTLSEMAETLDVPESEVLAAATGLCRREIAFAAGVSKSMAKLQDYYGSLRIEDDVPTHFADLWRGLGKRYDDAPLLRTEDGTEYDWPSVSRLVAATVRWLQQCSEVQDRVLIHSGSCPELFLVVWACWLSGRVAVPVDAALPADVVRRIVERVGPVIVFSDRDFAGAERLTFDSLAGDADERLYSDRIAAHLQGDADEKEQESECDETSAYEPRHCDTALVLFTSGSTGEPKAVRLDQRGLLHSAYALCRHFGWRPGAFLSLGPPHTMSGLRNPAIAALAAGATVVLPDPGLMHPARLLRLSCDHDVRYLATVPALLQQLAAARTRLREEPRPARLEQILTTGQALPESVRGEVEEFLGVPVLSYYGLTETGGICTADPTDGPALGNLGVPVGAVAQVVDGEDRVLGPGVTGELRIFSPANMKGYLESGTKSSVHARQGWILTGDVARLAPDGSFELLGRQDDQVKNRHGELLYLQELERVATSLAEIRDACCLERPPDSDLPGGIVLLAVIEDGRDPVAARNRLFEEIDRVLGARKRPDEFRTVPAIRRLSNGKVDRHGMLA